MAKMNPGVTSVLDIGCGIGLQARALAELFPDAQVIGIDNFEPAIAIARGEAHPPNLEFVVMDVNKLNGLGKFDLVSASCVIHHFDEIENAFGRIYNALNDDGRFYFTDLSPIFHEQLLGGIRLLDAKYLDAVQNMAARRREEGDDRVAYDLFIKDGWELSNVKPVMENFVLMSTLASYTPTEIMSALANVGFQHADAQFTYQAGQSFPETTNVVHGVALKNDPFN
ncbi:class I SAM-dependent methyltransferase [Nanoarchaeota archaeon]